MYPIAFPKKYPCPALLACFSSCQNRPLGPGSTVLAGPVTKVRYLRTPYWFMSSVITHWTMIYWIIRKRSDISTSPSLLPHNTYTPTTGKKVLSKFTTVFIRPPKTFKKLHKKVWFAYWQESVWFCKKPLLDTWTSIWTAISLSFLNRNGWNLVSRHIFSRFLCKPNFSSLSSLL